MWYTRNIFLLASDIVFINWTVRMSDNLPERVQILCHAHIICITVWENRIICCQIFCDLLLKSAFEWIFNVMQLILVKTRKNCFRYLKLMYVSPECSHLYNNKLHIMSWMILFKKQLFDLEVKGQCPTKVIMVRDTPPYGHAPTYQISLTYLERQKCYGPDKKMLFKKQLFDLEVKGQGPTKVITVCNTHTKYNWPIWKDKNVMIRTSSAEKKQKKWKKKQKKRKKKSD